MKIDMNRTYTVAEYMALPDDGNRYELIDGKLIDMDNPEHGRYLKSDTPAIPVELQTALLPPTLADVYAARKIIYNHLRPTPLVFSPGLSRLVGGQVYLKLESTLPTGAFKVRGGLNLMARLSDEHRKAGVMTASTGNHGQSIAYAARAYGVKATIVAPLRSNEFKLAAMRNFGAEVLEVGSDFDEARMWAGEEALRRGARFIHSGDEPDLIAGVATCGLEIIEEVPDLDVVIVPIGGGSGACGQCIATKGVNPDVQVIAVQAEGASAVYQTWHSRSLRTTEHADTFAEGVATRIPFALPYNILSRLLDDLVLVSDTEMRDAIRKLLEHAHQVAEGAGAAPLAAALRYHERFAGKKIALILSGGNITYAQLKALISESA